MSGAPMEPNERAGGHRDPAAAAARRTEGPLTTQRSEALALLRIVVPYATLAAIWILASDTALLHLTSEAEALARWSTFKGIAFVAVTSALLAYLVRRELRIQQRQQSALTDSESRYRQLFEANPQPMWVYDAQTTAFLAVNDAAVAQYGWSREEFLRMTIADIRPPEDIPRLRQRLAELAPGVPHARSGVWQHRKKDGSRIDVEIISHALQFNGRPARVVVAVDVTARSEAERALRESEARHRAIFENPHTPMLIVDPEDGRIVDANAAAARFYGLSREQLLARTGAELNTLSEAEHRAALAAAATQQRSVFHFRHRAAGGELRDVDVYSGPIERDGRRLLLSVVHDETARHRAERALRRMNRMYATLSQTNQLVVRAQDRASLLEGVCRIAVEHGGFKFACVGAARGDGAIEVVARAGADDGAVETVCATAAQAGGAAARAIALGTRVVVGELRADPDRGPVHDAAVRAGVSALVALPLRESGAVIGALSLYAAQASGFDAAELETLDGMASDVSFGLDNLRRVEALQAALHVVEASPVVLFRWRPEPDWPVQFVSNNVARWGYPAQSFLEEGRTYGRIVHPDDRARVQAQIEQQLAAGRDRYVLTYRIVTAAGEVRWVEESTAVERTPSGAVLSLEGTVADVTDRKRMEDELRMLSLAVEQSADSIVITDLDGRIEYVNAAHERMSGYPREELLGRNPRMLQSGKTPLATYADLWSTLLRGEVWRGEFVNRHKNGAEYIEEAVITPIRQSDGRVVRYLAVMQDVTAKRRLADELQRYQQRLEELVAERTAQLAQAHAQAEAANQAKSAFLASMSHEIRTPMNGVLGMLELLAATRLTEQQADMVRTARESGRTLLALIDDILDFSKIEAGRMQVERVPMSVADVAEGLCDALVPVANRREVELSVFVAPEIPEHVLADPLRLRQILFNLLGNAIKFSGGEGGRRGRVALRVTVASRDPLQLAFAVIDNGIGIAPEVMGRLFTPFAQGEVSTTRRFGGTGLGLAICKRLADLMQARIDVESEPGQGSTFTLMLPVEACAEQPRRELPDVAGIHCLVFESDAFASDDVCAYLSHAGARVQRVTDVRAAAALAATLPAPVVAIRHAGAHPARVAPWRDAPHVRQLLITRGQRRRARVEATGAVTLDGAALRRQALLGAVAVAAGRASPPPVPAPHVTVAARAPSIEQARDRGDLILVAEDDPVNQLVIRQQLEVLGHAAEIAADGEEALARWRAGRYALLLTDLHMPRMDGWSLARAIRQEEQERGGAPRLPIVALTANALREEAERARAAGIDGYLTKPASLEQLRLTLAQWLRPRTAAAAWDVEVLRALAGDDGATLRELLTTFLAVLSEQAPALRAAAEGGDLRSAAAIAHKLKSSARSVGAFALGDLCAELETALKSGVRIGAEPLARLAAAVARVEAEIGAFLAAPRRT